MFVIFGIIAGLFLLSTGYWLGYGYGSGKGFEEGQKQQHAHDAIKLTKAYDDLRQCSQTVDYQNSAIDTMKEDRQPPFRTTSHIIDLARYRGKDC